MSFVLVLCEQPKPLDQLPIFDRIACIPVTSTISVVVPSKYTSTEVQTFAWDKIKTAMATGDLNTPNQVVGLVFTGTPHTKANTSGAIKKEMRPVGKGLLSAGCIILFFLIVGLVAWRIIKKRRNSREVQDDDLSLQKDDEEASFAPTDSFVSEDASPKKEAPESYDHDQSMNHTHEITRKQSEASRYSAYPTTKSPTMATTSNASVKKSQPKVEATNEEEYEINQFFACCK